MGTGSVDVAVAFDGDAVTINTWTTISSSVQQAVFSRGRSNPADPWSSNTATVVLLDTTREFDPLNTAGTYAGDLTPGKQIRIRVRDADDNIIRVWYGVIRKWVPAYYSGGSAGTTTITAVDRIGALIQPLPLFPNDWLGAQISKGPGCFYVFTPEFVDVTTGVVTDLSGQNRDGLAVTDWVTDTPGAALTSDDALVFDNSATFRPGIPVDPIAAGSGWGFVAEFRIEDPPSNTSGGISTYPLFEDSWGNAASENYWQLKLERTVANDDMHLVIDIHVQGETVQTESDFVGSASDWIDQRRVAGVAVDRSTLTLFSAVPEDGTGDLGGTGNPTVRTRVRDYDFGGTHPPADNTEVWNSRLGRFLSTADPVAGRFYAMAMWHSGTSETTALGIAEAFETYGLTVPNTYQRVNQVIKNLTMRQGFMTVEIANNVAQHPAAGIGLASALAFFQQLAQMGQGRLYQNNVGEVILEDMDHPDGVTSVVTTQSGGVLSTTTTTETPTTVRYSDQPGEVSQVPSWKEGTAVLRADFGDSINDVTVTTPGGYVARASDSSSIAAIGIRSKNWQLPFSLASDADQFVTDLIARYKDPEYSAEFVVEPDANPAVHWAALAAKDIGDLIDWTRQPLGIGPVTTTTMQLGGEQWTYNGFENHFKVTLYLEPDRPGL